MDAIMYWIKGAIQQTLFISSTLDVINVDGPSHCAKVSTCVCQCIYKRKAWLYIYHEDILLGLNPSCLHATIASFVPQ